jgi:hypothetical protein
MDARLFTNPSIIPCCKMDRATSLQGSSRLLLLLLLFLSFTSLSLAGCE